MPLIIYLNYINVPNEMTYFISSFFIYLFIYKGTSGLAYNVAVLNGPIKKKTDTKEINT